MLLLTWTYGCIPICCCCCAHLLQLQLLRCMHLLQHPQRQLLAGGADAVASAESHVCGFADLSSRVGLCFSWQHAKNVQYYCYWERLGASSCSFVLAMVQRRYMNHEVTKVA
jgi:hypothetical protein